MSNIRLFIGPEITNANNLTDADSEITDTQSLKTYCRDVLLGIEPPPNMVYVDFVGVFKTKIQYGEQFMTVQQAARRIFTTFMQIGHVVDTVIGFANTDIAKKDGGKFAMFLATSAANGATLYKNFSVKEQDMTVPNELQTV